MAIEIVFITTCFLGFLCFFSFSEKVAFDNTGSVFDGGVSYPGRWHTSRVGNSTCGFVPGLGKPSTLRRGPELLRDGLRTVEAWLGLGFGVGRRKGLLVRKIKTPAGGVGEFADVIWAVQGGNSPEGEVSIINPIKGWRTNEIPRAPAEASGKPLHVRCQKL